MKQYIAVLILFLMACQLPAFSQPPDRQRFILDSLNTALRNARHDTDRVKIRDAFGPQRVSRIGYWDSVATDAHRLRMTMYESRALNRMGNMYTNLADNTRKGIEYNKKALQVAEENNHKPEMARALLSLTGQYLRMSDTRTGLNYYFRGIKLAEEIGNPHIIAWLNKELAYSYIANGEYKKALTLHLKRLKILLGPGDAAEMADVLLDIGDAYRKLGDEQKVTEYFMASRKYLDKIGVSPMACQVNIAMASAYYLKKQPDSTIYYFNAALKTARNIGSKRLEAAVLNERAEINYKQGNLKGAEKDALECLRISQAVNLNIQIPPMAGLLSKIYERKNDPRKALEFYKLYVTSRDSASNEEQRKEALEKEFAYNFEKKRK